MPPANMAAASDQPGRALMLNTHDGHAGSRLPWTIFAGQLHDECTGNYRLRSIRQPRSPAVLLLTLRATDGNKAKRELEKHDDACSRHNGGRG
jgi:hypothetical protein